MLPDLVQRRYYFQASSFVPSPIALSSAEAEINAMTVACMATNYMRQIICDVRYGYSSRPFTVPILTDSSSGIFITMNDRDSQRTRHIERRYLFVRTARQNAWVSMHFISGDEFNIADLGTKNVPAQTASYKLSIV